MSHRQQQLYRTCRIVFNFIHTFSGHSRASAVGIIFYRRRIPSSRSSLAVARKDSEGKQTDRQEQKKKKRRLHLHNQGEANQSDNDGGVVGEMMSIDKSLRLRVRRRGAGVIKERAGRFQDEEKVCFPLDF